MQAPLGVVNLSFYLCPAVSAAVAGVNLVTAYRLCKIRIRRAVAVAVALAVDKEVVGADDRPILLGVGIGGL